jgi:imidazolonepropionase-like amidohydrolase
MNKLFMIILLFGILCIETAISQDDRSPPIALANVTIIDGTGAEPEPGMTVLIEGERIMDVFRTGGKPLPENTEVRDLSGKYLIPGLINTHVHFTNFTASLYTDDDVSAGWERTYRELERMIYGGVTAVRDVANDFRVMAGMERDLAMGRYPGPDLYHATVLAGPEFFEFDPRGRVAPPEFWPRRSVHTGEVAGDADIRALVAGAAARGAMGLKLYMHLDASRIEELAREAHRQGLKVLSHATVYPDRPIDVIRAGVNSVSHASGLVWQAEALDPSKNIPFVHTAGRTSFDPDLVDPDGPEFDELFTEMVERGVILDATTSMLMGGLGTPFGYTPELMVELMQAAHRAGVLISTGTDYFADTEVSFLGIDYDVDLLSQPWPAVFQEIEHLVDDDIMTPIEAITAATLNGARAIGIEDTHGTIESGKAASMVVLAEDPTKEIGALRTVETVFKRGVEYPRSDYRMPESLTGHKLSGKQRDAIKAELREIRKQRYEALERGDCEAVVETFDENVTFYNTRGMQVPSTDVAVYHVPKSTAPPSPAGNGRGGSPCDI